MIPNKKPAKVIIKINENKQKYKYKKNDEIDQQFQKISEEIGGYYYTFGFRVYYRFNVTTLFGEKMGLQMDNTQKYYISFSWFELVHSNDFFRFEVAQNKESQI
jgi:hypothetical protein